MEGRVYIPYTTHSVGTTQGPSYLSNVFTTLPLQ